MHRNGCLPQNNWIQLVELVCAMQHPKWTSSMETGVAQGQWYYVGPNKCHWNWDHRKVSIKRCSTEYQGCSFRILGHRLVTHSGWVTHNSHQFVPINYLISNYYHLYNSLGTSVTLAQNPLICQRTLHKL